MNFIKSKTDIRIVHKNWLWQRAGALETKLLKKYGQSLARISIDNRFNKCVKCSYVDEPIMEIDYNEYRQICREIEEEYRSGNK